MRPHQEDARTTVRAAMHERGLEVAALSRETGLDPGTITDFLNGTRWPRVSSLSALERFFGWDPGHLAELARTGQKNVSTTRHDDGVLLDIDPAAFSDLDETERAEALAAAKLTYLQRAREIRQGREGR